MRIVRVGRRAEAHIDPKHAHLGAAYALARARDAAAREERVKNAWGNSTHDSLKTPLQTIRIVRVGRLIEALT